MVTEVECVKKYQKESENGREMGGEVEAEEV